MIISQRDKEIKKNQDTHGKIKTFKECVWYLADIDKCKLPGVGSKYSNCFAKQTGKLDEFCIEITEFLNPTTEVEEEHKQVQLELFDSYEPFIFGGTFELAPASYLDKLFEQAYKTLKKWKEGKTENA